MSGMAQEIQNRIEQDAGAGLAPGSAETPPGTPEQPPAGAYTTDTAQGQGPPESIPYARFKEVNDRLAELKGYEELASYGYDSDSLGRLAAFEAQYMTDPVGTVSKMIDDLDLPQELKESFREAATGAGASAQQQAPDGSVPEGGGTPSETPPAGANLPPDVQSALRWIENKQAEEAQQASEAVLDSVVGHWDNLDKEAGLETPKHIQLAFISSAAAAGGFASTEQLAEMARRQLMDYRDAELGSVVSSGRPGGVPALPGGGPAIPAPERFGDIRDASKQAIADIQAGRLPIQ